MKNVLKDLRNIAILFLVTLVIGSQFKSCRPEWPWNQEPSDTIGTKIDTVYKDVKTETKVYIPKWRTKIRTKIDTVKIEKFKDVDTTAILVDYYSSYKYVDTLNLSYTDSLGKKHYFGKGIVTDTVSKNRIIGRGIVWNYKIPYVGKHITIEAPPRRQLYIGGGVAFSSGTFVNNVSGGLIYKNRQDKMYQMSLGLTNVNGNVVPFIGGAIFWKIRLKR